VVGAVGDGGSGFAGDDAGGGVPGFVDRVRLASSLPSAIQTRSMAAEPSIRTRWTLEILGHARVTTTERYTHVASPQIHDASERMGAAQWGSDRSTNRNRNKIKSPSPKEPGEGL
jgi:hypothetical protein